MNVEERNVAIPVNRKCALGEGRDSALSVHSRTPRRPGRRKFLVICINVFCSGQNGPFVNSVPYYMVAAYKKAIGSRRSATRCCATFQHLLSHQVKKNSGGASRIYCNSLQGILVGTVIRSATRSNVFGNHARKKLSDSSAGLTFEELLQLGFSEGTPSPSLLV